MPKTYVLFYYIHRNKKRDAKFNDETYPRMRFLGNLYKDTANAFISNIKTNAPIETSEDNVKCALADLANTYVRH